MKLDFKVERIALGVTEQNMKLLGNNEIVGDSKNYIYAHFRLPNEWKELTKQVYFNQSATSLYFVLTADSNNSVLIPHELMDHAGEFTISLVGTGDDKRITTNQCVVYVRGSGIIPPDNPSVPTIDFLTESVETVARDRQAVAEDTAHVNEVATVLYQEITEKLDETIETASTNTAENITTKVQGLMNDSVATVNAAKTTAVNTINSAKETAESVITAAKEETITTVTNIKDTAVNKITSDSTKAVSDIELAKTTAEATITSLKADALTGITGAGNSTINSINNLKIETLDGIYKDKEDALKEIDDSKNAAVYSVARQQNEVRKELNTKVAQARSEANRAELMADRATDKANAAQQIANELPERINGYVAEHTEELRGHDGPTGPQGPTGPAGRDGVDGKDGANGKDGKDGVNGEVTKAQLDEAKSELSDEIVQIQSVVKLSPNLFIADIRPNTNINNNTGIFTETTSNQNTVATETMIRVIAGEKYTISCNSANFFPPIWVYYGNNKEFKGINTSVYTTVIPNDVSYLRFKWNRTGQTTQMASAFNHNVQLELGEVATDFVLPFQASLKDNVVDTKNIINQSVTVEKLAIVEQTKNIFDYDDFKPRYALNNQGDRKPIIASDVKYGCSIKGISVVSGATYTVTKYFKDTESIPYGFVYEYDVDDNFIQRQNVVNGTTITLSNETKYIRVQESAESGTDMLERFPYLIYQLEMGNVQTEFTYPKIVKEQYLPIPSVKDSDTTKQLSDINEQIDIQRPKIIKRNTKEFVNFGFVTDTHLEGIDGNRTGLVDIKTINEIGAENWLDFVVHCGDIFNSYESGSVNGSQGITFDKALQRIDDALSGFKNIRVPIFIARGNHDVNDKFKPNYPSDVVDKTQHITQEQFKLLCQNQFRQNVNGEYKCSFYKDFDDKKVRIIVFDVYINDNQSPAFSNYSLNWLANTALKLDNKNDYSVLLIAHTFDGNVLNTLNDLIGAFKNGGTFTNSALNVSANYSSQGACDFIGCICGHTHIDNQTNENGYWYLTSGTSYLKTDINLKSNIYANVYTIDTDNHILYKQKLGANGNSYAYNWRDLTYTQV